MIKLRSLWNVPAGTDPSVADHLFADVHLPRVRTVQGLRVHVVIRFISDPRGGHPWWHRGEELWFDDEEALAAFAAGPDGAAYTSSPLWEAVAGPRTDVFDIEDVFDSTGIDGPSVPLPGEEITCLTGVWQVPPESTHEIADEVYFRAHVPGVRKLPDLVRHSVLKSKPWPEGQHARFWRSAEIRFASREQFDAAFSSPAYALVRVDGFNASVVGPEVDIFAIEEEWTPAQG